MFNHSNVVATDASNHCALRRVSVSFEASAALSLSDALVGLRSRLEPPSCGR